MDTDTLDRPVTAPKFELLPVIFANGEDDDLPGLVAAVLNEKVQFDERTYAPGEPIEIVGRSLLLSKGLCILGATDEVEPEFIDNPKWVVVRQPTQHRALSVRDCMIKCLALLS